MKRVLKSVLTTLLLLGCLSSGAQATSNMFTGGYLYQANPYDRNGCCGYFLISVSADNAGPYGNVLVSNYLRTALIWINPVADGWYTVSAAFADYLGAFNTYEDYANPQFGNRVIATSTPIQWTGFDPGGLFVGIGDKIEVQWDMTVRSISFAVNDIPYPSIPWYNSGPNAGFAVNYAQSTMWYYGADSPMLMLYGNILAHTYMGYGNVPQATGQMALHLWDNGATTGAPWDYGPHVFTKTEPGPVGVVPNYFPLNLYGWSGTLSYPQDTGTACCVDIIDIQFE